MKLICIIFVALFSVPCMAQQPTMAEQLSARIARKIRDTLQLSAEQQEQLYQINMLLHQRKMDARRQHPSPAEAAPYIQIIENSRDSLYRQVIPADRYGLYQQKKTKLVSNNG
jgi:hypothetical protein